MTHNNTLQLTIDPAESLAAARAPSASIAAEHRRYASRLHVLSALFIAAVSSLTSVACMSEPQHISAEQFCELYRTPTGTMRYTEFHGVKDGRAYISLHEMSSSVSGKWSESVFSAGASEASDLCLGGLSVSPDAKARHNQSLQQTLDPVATLAFAKPAPASIAAEPRRYIAKEQ